MKKPQPQAHKRKKPEFRVGQVVATRELGFVFWVNSKRWYGNRWQYLSPQYDEYDEVELRSLNKRERGQ
jgi:hypothetical protein